MNLKFIILLSASIILGSCNTSKKTFTNGEKWIPNDFEPAKTILLIEKFTISQRVEQNMEEYVKGKYPFKYEFVSLETIKNKTGKYSDTKLYRHALVISSHTSHLSQAEGAATSGGLTTTGFDYNFYDQDKQKPYPSTGISNSYIMMTFKPVINTIVKKYK